MARRFGSPPEQHRKSALFDAKMMRKHARTLSESLARGYPADCPQAMRSLIWMHRWNASQQAETRGAGYYRGGRGQSLRVFHKLEERFKDRCLVRRKRN